MTLPAASLSGFRGFRAEVLVALKKRQPLTARELAVQFRLTPNALRRHLKSLEEGDLVQYRPVVRGVGAPVFAYSLSEAGEALFPRAYEPALAEALDAVRAECGADGVRQVFVRRWERQAGDAARGLATLPPAERAQLLAELLTAEGYMAEARMESPERGELRVFNCAMRAVAERFPEICAAEVAFLEQALGATFERREHIAGGCNACTYQFSFAAPSEGSPDRSGDGARFEEVVGTCPRPQHDHGRMAAQEKA